MIALGAVDQGAADPHAQDEHRQPAHTRPPCRTRTRSKRAKCSLPRQGPARRVSPPIEPFRRRAVVFMADVPSRALAASRRRARMPACEGLGELILFSNTRPSMTRRTKFAWHALAFSAVIWVASLCGPLSAAEPQAAPAEPNRPKVAGELRLLLRERREMPAGSGRHEAVERE